jgi:hypothetical protein
MGRHTDHGHGMGEHTHEVETDSGKKGYGHTEQEAWDNASQKDGTEFSWHPLDD